MSRWHLGPGPIRAQIKCDSQLCHCPSGLSLELKGDGSQEKRGRAR